MIETNDSNENATLSVFDTLGKAKKTFNKLLQKYRYDYIGTEVKHPPNARFFTASNSQNITVIVEMLPYLDIDLLKDKSIHLKVS